MTKLEQSIIDEYKFCIHQAQRGYQPNLKRLLDKILLNQFYSDIDKTELLEVKMLNYSQNEY